MKIKKYMAMALAVVMAAGLLAAQEKIQRQKVRR